jgi:hypothetical protein
MIVWQPISPEAFRTSFPESSLTLLTGVNNRARTYYGEELARSVKRKIRNRNILPLVYRGHGFRWLGTCEWNGVNIPIRGFVDPLACYLIGYPLIYTVIKFGKFPCSDSWVHKERSVKVSFHLNRERANTYRKMQYTKTIVVFLVMLPAYVTAQPFDVHNPIKSRDGGCFLSCPCSFSDSCSLHCC